MSDFPRPGWPTGALLTATIVLLSLGQVLFKWASAGLDPRDPRTLASPALVSALVLYGLATVSWLLVLKKMPLSVAFPLYGVTFLLVPALAHYLLGEKVGIQTFLGGMLIIFGMLVANWGKLG